MNYIKKLEAEKKTLDAQVEALRDMIHDLSIYMHSPKFSADPYVNKSDVLLRITQGLQYVEEVAGI